MIVGLTGYARVGKDTVADAFVDYNDFQKMSFADPMREALLILDPWIFLGNSHVHLSSAVRILGWDILKQESEDIRPLMQKFGTEVCRNMFGQNVWVDLAMARADKSESDVVFADVRFKNEAEAIRAAGGVIIRVIKEGIGPANSHVSESDMDDYEADYVISNNGTPAQLISKVNVLLAALEAWT